MSSKMMKVCGKTADGLAHAIAVGDNGEVITKRHWETANTSIFAGYITNGVVAQSDTFDCSEWGIVSLRISHNGADGTPPVRFHIYGDRNPADGVLLKDINGDYITVTVQPKSTVTITPDDLPTLNYLHYLKLRLALVQADASVSANVYINANVIAKR